MPIDALLAELSRGQLPSRIWSRDPAAFVAATGLEAAKASILNRLGWLDAPANMPSQVSDIEAFTSKLRGEGLTDVFLLGMGGSSLCAEVLRDVLGTTSGVRLTVLDTTDETVIGQVTDQLVPERACFLVASKSGSTLEVSSLERHFSAVMSAAVADPGRHFTAITDPKTELVEHAAHLGYRHTFINPPDIGGRYSALSLFGLVPANLVGVSGMALLAPAAGMANACRSDDVSNPGLALGAFMGGHALAGRDKLTLLTSAAFGPFGVWVEQLVAESTGKHGLGVLPVVGEPPGPVSAYGADRAFVAVITPGDEAVQARAAALEQAGHPVFRIETTPDRLGAEFFRWEFATAVAGAVLEVNPFDEPDVRGAKLRTQAQLDAWQSTGRFKTDPAFQSKDGYLIREFSGAPGRSSRESYVALLDYLPVDPSRDAVVASVRAALGAERHHATTHGVGPRYLHSTGQYHKGGPNTGLFVLLTATDVRATEVPGAAYTFSTLKQAQGFGDFDALRAAGRHVVHCHFEDAHADIGTGLTRLLADLS